MSISPIKKFVCIFHLLLIFVVAVSCAQTGFRVTNYDETSGLQSRIITAILQDTRGFIWLGTADGLYRYDGYGFKIFKKTREENNTIPANYVTRLAEDHKGNIWIGFFKDGISCYNPASGNFKNYDLKNVDSVTSLMAPVSMLFIDKQDNVWIGITQRGILQLNIQTEKIKHYNIVSESDTFYTREIRSIYNTAYAMYEDEDGLYWLATHDGLYCFNNQTKQMIAVRKNFLRKTVLRDDLFTSLLADKDELWLGSWAGGLTHYNIKTREWKNYKFNQRNKNIATTNIINDVKFKNESELWIATNDKGLGIFNKKNGSFSFPGDDSVHPNNIPGKFCYTIMQDKQGNIWLSHENGLCKMQLTEKKFIYQPVAVSRSDNGTYYGIQCMLEDKEEKYFFIGTSFADGLHVTNKVTGKTKIIQFNILPGEESLLSVEDLMEDSKGNTWVLTRDFIYQYNKSTENLVAIPQPPPYRKELKSNHFNHVQEDNNGNIWITSSRNGIFCFNTVTQTYKHYYNDLSDKKSLRSNVIESIAVDGLGRVWIGGTKGCFGYFDTTDRFINLNLQNNSSEKITDNRTHALYADKNGNIWTGTDIGLFCYDARKLLPELKKKYTGEGGLRGDIVAEIKEDYNKNIWCITVDALCKIDKATNNVTVFGKLDGLDKNINNLYAASDGSMYLLSSGGYYVFNPSSFHDKKTALPVVITSFKVDDKEQHYEEAVAVNRSVIVPANANVISFEFAALDFSRPDEQQYAYMLEGFDKNWIMAGQRRYVSYTNIPGGNYVFKVKATNAPDNWNVQVISIPLHIDKPFYATWIFIVFVILSVAAILYALYRFKLEKQEKIFQLETKAQVLEKEKTQAKYENLKQHLNPHFLFNSLTSLSSLIRFDQKLAGEFLDGLSRIYRYILKSRDNETVSLIEEIKFVQSFIRLQQTRFTKGLQVNIDIDEAYNQSKIAPVTLQNLVENAIKHNIIDDESPLIIDIFTEDNYLVVKNNLQKKNFVETSNQQGLSSLQSLYHYLSSKPVIIIENEQCFFVKIPLIEDIHSPKISTFESADSRR